MSPTWEPQSSSISLLAGFLHGARDRILGDEYEELLAMLDGGLGATDEIWAPEGYVVCRPPELDPLHVIIANDYMEGAHLILTAGALAECIMALRCAFFGQNHRTHHHRSRRDV